MERLDLEGIRHTWLKLCGSCDAGLPMGCTCPDDDPRNVIKALVDHLEHLYVNQELLMCSTLSEAWDRLETLQRCQDLLYLMRDMAEHGAFGKNGGEYLLELIKPELLEKS